MIANSLKGIPFRVHAARRYVWYLYVNRSTQDDVIQLASFPSSPISRAASLTSGTLHDERRFALLSPGRAI